MSLPLTRYLLNLGHAIDHMFMLIFATAVTSIAKDFGIAHWEDLMPYSVAAFLCFGLGSFPSGRLGDLWGRRPMMIVFFFGIGAAAILVSMVQSLWQLAAALALLGCFASIYHPVGVPMLVQGQQRPGWLIGVNGLIGNLGLAGAAVVTGFLIKYAGWRTAFFVPGAVSLLCGFVFLLVATRESASPAKKKSAEKKVSDVPVAKLLLIMTAASTSGGLLFNFAANSNYELLAHRLQAISQDPASIGALLAGVYVAASLTQLLIGRLLDGCSLKRLYLGVVATQMMFLIAAALTGGWVFYVIQFFYTAAIFAAIPFTDAMVVRFVDDSMRSRVAGMRFAVSFGASSLAVWLIGPVVKQAGFTALLWGMAATSMITFLVVSTLPKTPAPTPA